jgi:hypothetical protein
MVCDSHDCCRFLTFCNKIVATICTSVSLFFITFSNVNHCSVQPFDLPWTWNETFRLVLHLQVGSLSTCLHSDSSKLVTFIVCQSVTVLNREQDFVDALRTSSFNNTYLT